MTEAEKRDGHERAEFLLSAAVRYAAEDGIVEVADHFLRARVRHALGRFAEARADWYVFSSSCFFQA